MQSHHTTETNMTSSRLSSEAMDVLYEVKESSAAGYGLFATQEIPAGACILEERPLIAVPRGSAMTSLILRSFNNLNVTQKASYMELCGRETPDGDTASNNSERSEEDSVDGNQAQICINDRSSNSAEFPDPVHKAVAEDTSFDEMAATLVEMSEGQQDVIENPKSDVNPSNLDPTVHQHWSFDSKEAFLKDDITDCNLPDDSIEAIEIAKSEKDFEMADPRTMLPRNFFHSSKIVNIFETNAFGCELADGSIVAALCLQASRLNHSCIQNVYCAFNTKSGTHTVHAAKHISAGDELLTSYINSTYLTTSERQVELSRWGFRCTCPACAGQIKGSETRRMQLQTLQSVANVAKEGMIRKSGSSDDPQQKQRYHANQTMVLLMQMAHLMEEEGLQTAELADICGAVGMCGLRAGRVEEALAFRQKKVNLLLCCYGCNSPVYQHELSALKRLRSELSDK